MEQESKSKKVENYANALKLQESFNRLTTNTIRINVSDWPNLYNPSLAPLTAALETFLPQAMKMTRESIARGVAVARQNFEETEKEEAVAKVVPLKEA